MPAAPTRTHTDAVASALAAAGVTVGRGQRPPGGGWTGEPGASTFVPYVVLYPSPGLPDGDLADVNEYLDYAVQLTAVAATSEGTEAVMDLAKTLVGQRLTVTDRQTYPVTEILTRPASRDDQVDPPLHYAVMQLGFRSGPT